MRKRRSSSSKGARLIAAWIIGLITFAILKIGIDWIADELGMVTFTIFAGRHGGIVVWRDGGHYSLEHGEIGHASVTFGTAVMVLAAMAAFRAGAAIYSSRIDGGLSERLRITFIAWFGGIFVVALGGVLLFALFAHSRGWFAGPLQPALEFGSVVVSFWFFRTWRARKLSKINQAPMR